MTDTATRPPAAPADSGAPAGAATDPRAAWEAWHAERERALTAPHGWLTPVALLWLRAQRRLLPGLPGLWSADDDGAHLLAVDDDALTDADGPVRGERTWHVPEDGSLVVARHLPAGRDPLAAPDEVEVVVELVRRTGRYGLRLRDPQAATRGRFTGVPTFPYDESWVLDAPVRWYDAPQQVVVGAAQPGLVHDATVVGEVDVERGGTVRTLRLVEAPGTDGVALLFSDEADDVAGWRVLHTARTADGATTLRLDLNRTLNLPYAFTDFGTCPSPVLGNHLPFAVEAGERTPTGTRTERRTA
ncbi:DUF1684 domain-containing protein [Cellulomonas fimi]|uniref:DUF1684 domain-containing protein n=1 Tax=Cellulomonas fimi (strain ATCC 484 / DSM 20113 / JCM 1341 / CCUG 24087 / LMG 16345 / NBRC 15513 / NCIMB 8980 / NCTC 7547 / NRS-133) TaxID=590998 RepID=F4H3A5_CELFA|nr:DUF1684 domain-containing protein [Cellulomonas fimi]AEE45326.1 protein of unknown function DUF1684 [Cellulomonas fimi ATCC 484]NNH07891.1 DUF1684 domain-containing protein [Cellulomonas fimi]VEH28974.1 Protein of uncharacterised function (DUF1684) [Cellulomonas fimi]